MGHSRTLDMVSYESFATLSYSHFAATMFSRLWASKNGMTLKKWIRGYSRSLTVSIEYRCDLENWVRGCSRSLKLAPLDRPYTTFYSYTYNGQSTESCIWSIERRHFQWPWTTLTTVSRSRHSLTLNISETVRYSVENTFCNFCSSI